MATGAACKTFESLKLKTPLTSTTLSSIKKLGFLSPTPVQSMCIPLILSNKDVVAEAVTGSGKTLAFLVPVIEMLLNRDAPLKQHDVGAVILTPTRELAQQINNVLIYFTENTDLTQILFVGGKSIKDNIKQFQLNGAHIVVATIGKFLALLQQKDENFQLKRSVKSLEILILDEADRLLSQKNFEADLSTILGMLPKQRRTSLFSATQTDKIEAFVRAGLRNPVQVIVREKKANADEVLKRTPDSLKNYFAISEGDEKLTKLIGFLRMNREKKNIVFFNTCACVDYYSKLLTIILKIIPVVSIHGQMKKKREEIFAKFQAMATGILLCTDVMARGIDIPKVDWVVQYDPPSSVEAFVHRCGRTARMGNIGNAIIFLLPNESTYIDFVRINQKVPLHEYTELPADTPNIVPKVRKIASRDRDIYEKGIRAFVSFIQSYRKHECGIIFQFNELDICKLATGFGLLRLPKMPDLKDKKLDAFIPSDVNPDDIKYKDKIREKQRQVKLEKLKEEELLRKGKNDFKKKESWSKKKEKIEKKTGRKEKRDLKRKFIDDKKNDEADEDAEELIREARLLKKLKKGKISEEQFDKEVDVDEIEKVYLD